MKRVVIILILSLVNLNIYGQNIEDALRFSGNEGIISARAGGFGTAFHGIADDYSTLAFNPAGLSLIDKGEMTFGMGFMMNSVETDFLSNKFNLTSNDAYLSNIGIVAPFKTKLGNAAIGIGHYMDHNFDNVMEFGAINPNSTYTKFIADDEKAWGFSNEESLPWNLWLADDYLNTPLDGDLYQEAIIDESGGLHNITGGIAFELSQFLSAGFSITGKWGEYEYLRQYKETDVNQVYEYFDTTNAADSKLIFNDLDFEQFRIDELINQNISGVTGSIGILGKIGNSMRMGLSVRFPTYYDIHEKFVQDASSHFDNGDNYSKKDVYENNYSFISPWVYSTGISVHIWKITLAAGLEYSDLSQMEFDNNYELESLNLAIKKQMNSRIKWGIGAEFEVPVLPVVLRTSYNAMTAPYVDDIEGAEWTSFAFGGGVYLAPNIRMDLLCRISDRTNYWHIYGNSEDTKLIYTRNPLDLGLQLTYRY
jgi:hypothetical protein